MVIFKRLKEGVIDAFRKHWTFKHAPKLGLDMDGDIVWIGGVVYYVHVIHGEFRRATSVNFEDLTHNAEIWRE